MGLSTAAPVFKSAFFARAVTLFATMPVDPEDPTQPFVVFGRPVTFPPDIISIGAVRSTQDPGPLGAARARDESLELDIIISVQRGGRDPETEQLCSDRAYKLLGILENDVRVVDTTVGGTVRECFLLRHTSEGSTNAEVLKNGRCIDILATFGAKNRIKGFG